MKHAFTKGLFVAATATLIAACSTDDAADQMPVAPGKIEVSLKAALPQSRAQIEVDESNGRFSGSWEATDEAGMASTWTPLGRAGSSGASMASTGGGGGAGASTRVWLIA